MKPTTTSLNGASEPRAWQWARWGIRLLIGVGLAALAIYLLSRQVHWGTALQYLRLASPVWVLVALGFILVNDVAKTLRWRLLFPPGQLPSRGYAFGALMSGQLLNFVLPLRSGDLTRAYFMGRYRGASTATAVGTIGAEKVIDLTILGFLFALVLPSFILPAWLGSPERSAFIGAIVGLMLWVGVLVALPIGQRVLARLAMSRPVLSKPSRALSGLLDGLQALRHVRLLPWLLAFSVAAWAAGILVNTALLRAVGLPPTLLNSVLVVLIIQSGISVPLAPGQIGVFEALAVLALSLTGLPAEQALAFGILLHIVVLSIPVVVGVPWLLRQSRGL